MQQMLFNTRSNAKNEIILNLFTQKVITYVTVSHLVVKIKSNFYHIVYFDRTK